MALTPEEEDMSFVRKKGINFLQISMVLRTLNDDHNSFHPCRLNCIAYCHQFHQ